MAKRCSFYTYRHTFASHLVMQGLDLTTIKELMGHKDIKMTLRYAHLAPGHNRKAINVLDKILRENSEKSLLHNFTSQSGNIGVPEKKKFVSKSHNIYNNN